jgi:hypothetical protein
MKLQRLARRRACTLGKYYYTLTGPKRLGRALDHDVRRSIAHISCRRDRSSGEQIAPERLFHDTTGVRHECNQEDNVDERGVIGDDYLPRSAEALDTFEPEREHANATHEADKQMKSDSQRLQNA